MEPRFWNAPFFARSLKARIIKPRLFDPLPITAQIRQTAELLLDESDANDLERARCRLPHQLDLCDAAALQSSGQSREASLEASLQSLGQSFAKNAIHSTRHLLSAATAVGNDQIVQGILLPNPTLEPASLDLERALLWAAALGREPIVRLLLAFITKSGYKLHSSHVPGLPHISSGLNYTIFQAASSGHGPIVDELITFSGGPSSMSKGMLTYILKSAISGGHHHLVMSLLQRFPELKNDVESIDYGLFCACKAGASAIANTLMNIRANLSRGARLGVANQCDILWATRMENLSILRLLFDNGRGCKSRYRHDHPIAAAAERGNLDIIRFFLSQGLHINGEQTCNITSLAAAAKSGELEVVRFLIDNCVNLKHKGVKALKEAAINGHADIVKLLIARGVPVNGSRTYGSPLREAVIHDQQDVVRTLRELGAKEISDRDGSLGLLFSQGRYPIKLPLT